METWCIHLLGGLTLTCDGVPLPPIPSTLARSLLAYLLTYRDRTLTRDLLAGTFWPDLPDATARRRLSQALWLIRKALEPYPILLTEGDTVQINPGPPLWLDVAEFESKKQEAENRNQNEASCLLLLASCTSLYRGEFLAGYYDDWVLVERERLCGHCSWQRWSD